MTDRAMGGGEAGVQDLSLPGGREAYLVAPLGEPRGPGVLYLHWFDPQAPDGNRGQFLDEASNAARELGAVALLPQLRFPWSADPSDAESDARRLHEELAGLRQAIDLLAGHPGVDPRRLAMVGHDFGAMYATLLAADDERLAAAVLVAATPRWADWFLPFWKIEGDRFAYMRALAPLDPIGRVGDIAPRPVLFQFARSDYFLAPMTGREFERAAGEPKQVKAYDADHAMRIAEARSDRLAFLRTTLERPA